MLLEVNHVQEGRGEGRQKRERKKVHGTRTRLVWTSTEHREPLGPEGQPWGPPRERRPEPGALTPMEPGAPRAEQQRRLTGLCGPPATARGCGRRAPGRRPPARASPPTSAPPREPPSS